MTSKQTLSKWFDDGVAKGATHMVIVCDTYDYEDFPSYVFPGGNVTEKVSYYQGQAMTRIMEVYDLTKPKSEQLNAIRAFNF